MVKVLSSAACVLMLSLATIGASASAQVLTTGRQPYGTSVMPVTMSLRGGAMLAPRSAGLAGVDVAVPSVSLLDGWEGRLDADVIFKANFAEINTVVPVTFSQIHYLQDMSGRSLYFGAGAGALLGGKAKLIGKGILGIELSARLGVEGNVIVTNDKTMVTVVGRLHL